MTVWVFNQPEDEEAVNFVYSSLKKGISRFGWSYRSSFDLHKMESKEWEELDEQETES